MTEVLASNIRDNAVSKFSKCFNDTKKGKELAIKLKKALMIGFQKNLRKMVMMMILKIRNLNIHM